MKQSDYLKRNKNFFPNASKLRQEFENVFAKPLEATEKRFCWDYWHVPDQYTFLRTPAWEFFSPKLYSQLHLSLLDFGQKVLGCHNITPPWLSLYTEGCVQEIHADVPHGPWAFVYSLSPWSTKKFSGGETIILKPETLDFFPSLGNRLGKGVNFEDLSLKIGADFNQLLVFDPRLPHGVREVRGVRDPLEGRLVIHGWFTDPAPFVTGGLEKKRVPTGKALDQAFGQIGEIIELMNRNVADELSIHGTLVYRLKVSATGAVTEVKLQSNTLVSLDHKPDALKVLLSKSKQALSQIKFPKAPQASEIVAPLLFR